MENGKTSNTSLFKFIEGIVIFINESEIDIIGYGAKIKRLFSVLCRYPHKNQRGLELKIILSIENDEEPKFYSQTIKSLRSIL